MKWIVLTFQLSGFSRHESGLGLEACVCVFSSISPPTLWLSDSVSRMIQKNRISRRCLSCPPGKGPTGGIVLSGKMFSLDLSSFSHIPLGQSDFFLLA